MFRQNLDGSTILIGLDANSAQVELGRITRDPGLERWEWHTIYRSSGTASSENNARAALAHALHSTVITIRDALENA